MLRPLTPLFLALLLGSLSPAAAAAQEAPPPPCSEPEARQFDFWVGDWDVFAGDRLVGHNRISRIQGGCTLLEEYDTLPRPYEGKSFNYFDPADGRWHQVWVDNGGTRLHLSGGFADGRMALSGDRTTAKGAITDRITWTDNPDGSVRQQWDVSQDGRATWSSVFDGTYRRRGGGPAPESE